MRNQESIHEYFFGEEPVVEINSPRVKITGNKSRWDSCAIKRVEGVVEDVDITSSRGNIKKELMGKNIMNHGGISNASSMYRQFSGAEELTLKEIEDAMNGGESLPVVADYVDAVRKSIIESGESKFKEVHGYDLSDFLKMSIFEVQQISKTPESKAAGIKQLDWKLVDVSTRGGKEGQTEIALYAPKAPFASGYDAGLIYIGESLWDETKKEITNVGLRGQTTTAQDFGVYGIDTIVVGDKEYELEGVGFLTEYGKRAVDEYKKRGCSGVEIITATWIGEDRMPRTVVPLRKIFIK